MLIIDIKKKLFSVYTVQKKKSKGKAPSLTVDKSYLACQHHIAMVTGLGMVQTDKFGDILGLYIFESVKK